MVIAYSKRLTMLPNLIIPVLNRYDLLQRMLDTVDMKIAHLVIIDNGNSMTEMRFPEGAQNVHVIPLPANLGVAGSWNLGVKSLPHHDRWFIASNDIMLAPNDLARLANANRDEVTLTAAAPFWQLFALGEEVVRKVGLFDESFHPAYFEDNDYERRVQHFGFGIRKLELGVQHDNSSTLRSSAKFSAMNNETFRANRNYFENKQSRGDVSPGFWSLTRRRRNDWLR